MSSRAPLVSCICVTQNRRFFLRRAIAYFSRAADAYRNALGGRAELVVVDGSEANYEGVLKQIPIYQMAHYHHFPSPEHSRTGWFHNEAVRRAKGEIIVHWDDDDWHDASRIAKQVLTLKESPEGAIAHTSRFYWYHVQEKQACLARTWHQGGGTVGAMFAYHRAVWEKTPFRDVPQGEDNWFWDDHQKAGTPFLDARDASFCMYVRHNRNGSPLVPGQYHAQETMLARLQLEKAGDLEFYDELSEILPLNQWNQARPRVVSPYDPSTKKPLPRIRTHVHFGRLHFGCVGKR